VRVRIVILQPATGGTDPRWFAFDLLWGDLRSIFTLGI
jgi:hypothetical protein